MGALEEKIRKFLKDQGISVIGHGRPGAAGRASFAGPLVHHAGSEINSMLCHADECRGHIRLFIKEDPGHP